MFAVNLISSEVHCSPSFNRLFDEFIAGMSFITEQSELEDYCTKFLRVCIDIGGPIAKTARSLQQEWRELGMEL